MEHKYTLYVWCADNEGGYGICPYGEFTPYKGYHPESGWRARPSVKIGDFTTATELASLLYHDCPECYKDENQALKEATEWLQEYQDEEANPEDYWY